MTVAEHRVLTQVLSVDAAADATFGMLTPLGETAWVEGWDPQFLSGDPERPVGGDVFLTHHGGEETLWVVADLDPTRRWARYVRVTPGNRVAIVEVACEPVGDNETRVSVTYTVTGLSEEGNARVRAFAESFAAVIQGWKPLMEAAIAAR